MANLSDGIRVFKSFVGNVVSPKQVNEGSSYLSEWLQMNYRFVDRYPNIPTTSLEDLVPTYSQHVVKMEVVRNIWNITPYELYVISCIAMANQPDTVFEFGTYDGGTTLQLAQCLDAATIYTIDFSAQPHPDFMAGERFLDTEYVDKIKQLYGDTTQYDFSEFHNKIDFAFVDGGHEYDVVKSDTENAVKMVKSGGIIIWDDYLNWKGVKQAIEELSLDYPVQHIAETKLAILKMP